MAQSIQSPQPEVRGRSVLRTSDVVRWSDRRIASGNATNYRETNTAMLYFIENVTSGIIKIGYTRRLTKRLRALRGTTGENLRVVGVRDGDRRIEKLLHWQFRHLRIDGEWFKPGDDLLEYIRTKGKEWNGIDENQEKTELVTIRLDEESRRKAEWSGQILFSWRLKDCLSMALKYTILCDHVRSLDEWIARLEKEERERLKLGTGTSEPSEYLQSQREERADGFEKLREFCSRYRRDLPTFDNCQ